MRMMNWTALGLAAGMSSCSLMASVTPAARGPVPMPAAAAVAQAAATPAATLLSRSAPRPA